MQSVIYATRPRVETDSKPLRDIGDAAAIISKRYRDNLSRRYVCTYVCVYVRTYVYSSGGVCPCTTWQETRPTASSPLAISRLLSLPPRARLLDARNRKSFLSFNLPRHGSRGVYLKQFVRRLICLLSRLIKPELRSATRDRGTETRHSPCSTGADR